jgi:hypothetical protein
MIWDDDRPGFGDLKKYSGEEIWAHCFFYDAYQAARSDRRLWCK